jgi:hypothetical protein
VPEQPADRKNEKALLRHLVQSYDQMIQFLRAHGAMCASLKAEQLLPLDEYLKLVGGGAPLSRKERKAVRDEHAVFHSESWLELLFQAIRTFVLGRVTLKAFRGLPGMAEAAGAISKEVGSSAYRAQAAVDACKAIQDARDKKETNKDKKIVAKKDEAPPVPLPSSLLYSTSELLLLRWLEYHSAVCPELPPGLILRRWMVRLGAIEAPRMAPTNAHACLCIGMVGPPARAAAVALAAAAAAAAGLSLTQRPP